MTTDEKGAGLKTAILSLSLLTIMAAAAVSPALAQIKQALGMSGTLAKLTLTLPALFIIPFSLVSGWLAARWSPRKVLLTGLAIFCVGGIGGGLAQNAMQLLALRALLGVGVGLIMPLSTSLIADFFDGEARTKMMGLSGSVSHLGGVLFLIVSGWLAALSWRYAFGVYGLALVSLTFVLLWLPEWQKKGPAIQGGMKLPGGVWWCALLGALMMVSFYAAPTTMSLYIAGEDTLASMSVPLFDSREALEASLAAGILPDRPRAILAEHGIRLRGPASLTRDLSRERQWTIRDEARSYTVRRTDAGLVVYKEPLGRPATAGLALSTMTIVGVISGMVLAPLMKLFGRFLGPVTIVSMGVGFWMLSVAQSMTMVFGGVVFVGLASGFMMPLLMLKVSRIVTPATRAMAMAILSCGVYLGQFTSPLILQAAASAFGRTDDYRFQFLALATALAAAAVIGFGMAAATKPQPMPQGPVRAH